MCIAGVLIKRFKKINLIATFRLVVTNIVLMDKNERTLMTIVDDVAPDLYRYFMGSFDHSTAADLVQETLIRLVTKYRRGEFDSSKGSIKSYALGIARFVRLEEMKKKSIVDLVDDEAQLDVTLSQTTDGDDQVLRLRWAIRQLNPIEQDLILQMIDEESSLEIISKRLSMPIGTVKSHIHRAKEKLKKILEVKS